MFSHKAARIEFSAKITGITRLGETELENVSEFLGAH